MVCNKCNNTVPTDSEYCPFCGNIIENAAPVTNIISDIEKGYTYLELKQWKDAEQIFKTAIVNNDNKAQAYIGKMLTRRKTDSIDSLVAKNKNLSNDADFKLALKYADGEYADYLKECALAVDKKNKKRTVILSSVCVSVVVLALLSYFVFIPIGRNFYYKDLLSDGKAQKAVKSYQSSKWFEYDKKAKDLFYENGLEFVEAKDYKNAEACFKVTNGYIDNENYYNYCKAQNLLADNNLESYNYFINCKDFLDSNEILNTNEYFVMVNKLQGEWEHPELKDAVQFKFSSSNETFYASISNEKISIKGIKVSGEYTKGKLVILDDAISLDEEESEKNYSIDCVSDTVIQIEHDMIDNIEWTKVE